MYACFTHKEGSMKKSLLFLLSASVLTGLFVGGCHKDDGLNDQAPAGVTNEEQAMTYFATNDEFVANEEVTFSDKAVESFNYGTFGKVDAAFTPLRWGRIVTSITRNVSTTIQPEDTISISLVEKTITGTLKIRGLNASNDTVTIDKPFTDMSTRKVIFKRVNRDTKRYWMNWVPVATSLVNGGTVGTNNSVKITKLQFFNPNGDEVVVTNPNEYYLRYRWLKLFGGGQKDVPELVGGQVLKIAVTVESTSPDTDLVALRYGAGSGQKKRVQLALTSEVNNGGTFTRVFEVSRATPQFMNFHRGFFHLGVEVMSKATLYDDAAPYSVNWWGVPYRVF
jgi:hypothetical protein